MAITHHPDESTLMSFAAGALPEAHAAVVSTHLMSCEACRREVRNLEFIGASLLADLDGTSSLSASAQRFDVGAHSAALPCAQSRLGDLESLDREDDPLVRLTGRRLEDISWKRLGWGVWHYPIRMSSDRGGTLRLLKVQSGLSLPEHGHGGNELTIVLAGSYRDEIGHFQAGDVADLDDSIEHQPVADKTDGCICLIATDSRARFKGVVGRLVQPFTGM